MTKKRRTSHTSQASTASTTSSSGDMYLSTRTRKSISKSRRSSAVDEKPPSRRASVAAALSLLSLPSFNEQLSAAQVANALDVHAMYKVKVDRSSRKLEYFFGEPTPVDVCISEINKEGLKAMLESKVPLCYFLYHLLDEFSSENLFFFLEVEQFENYKKKSSRKHKEMARRIYDTYIVNDSYLEVNLDDRVKRHIADQMNAENDEICPSIFAEAQTCAYIMLESSFIRFLHTSVYEDMVENCGFLNIHYDKTVTSNALNYLTQYLRHQQDMVIMHSKDHGPLGDSLTEMNIRHYDLTKAVVNGFIKDLFSIDYFDSSSLLSSSASSNSSSSSTKSVHLPSKKLTKKRPSIKIRENGRRISM
ncbi:RGS domain-containing protein [Mucor lusitanicus]|uniref:RGS domain-containing protein n=1 Tax=Mucor circinelloides f. lusitanicus TaxID=29924 RepID=A0A8H4B7D9_MUCCL|nr:RGS domain-containing protein [Mucor lusitanicus]